MVNAPNKTMKTQRCPLRLEQLENRFLLATQGMSGHNELLPADVDGDGVVSPVDALVVINQLSQQATDAPSTVSGPSAIMADVNGDGLVSPHDALFVINQLPNEQAARDVPTIASSTPAATGDFFAVFDEAATLSSDNLLTSADVDALLDRAEQASASNGAIIAIVDRGGRILGVRVEAGVSSILRADADQIAFAIDGAVAKARTAAFFSSGQAPLTSRTIRFISQSTVTQREVQSSPLAGDPKYQGPGFVAPIGVGGHFPPEIPFTPQVDLFAIEHQSRDSQLHAGMDQEKGTGDDFRLGTRFNVDPDHIAMIDPAAPASFDPADFFSVWPESYGATVGCANPALCPGGMLPGAGIPSENGYSRGIATLPGGVPLYKIFKPNTPSLVGGIGVFFPGPTGFATHEQAFRHEVQMPNGNVQSEFDRTNADLVLESEFIAVAAAAANDTMVGPSAFVRSFAEFGLPTVPRFVLPTGRLDLVGITLEVFGPTPTRAFPIAGIDRLLNVGRQVGQATTLIGVNYPINQAGATSIDGMPVPERWLIEPHNAPDGTLTGDQVRDIIENGIAEAEVTRAAIRLDENFRPGVATGMVLAVADTQGNLVGLYRMEDATIFSIDVAVAKARNTAYYADDAALRNVDRIDFNGDGTLTEGTQDTVRRGVAFTNRTFRFIVEPRFPTGAPDLTSVEVAGLQNNNQTLCQQRPTLCVKVGPQSILRMPGINPRTGENLDNASPLPVDVYRNVNSASFLAFDAFNPARNFRDPGDIVPVFGTADSHPFANQNGIVFFPGSAPLYVSGQLAGGFGVSGDGVDQDDVVTSAGFFGFEADESARVDQFFVGSVRLPYVKFNRKPQLP